MWFIGALIGALLGAAIGHQFWLLGGLIGAAAAKLISRYAGGLPASPADVLQRLQHLEDEVAELRESIAAMQAKGNAAHAAPAVEPGETRAARSALPTEQAETHPAIPAALAALGRPFVGEEPAVLEAPPATEMEMPEWMKKFWASNPLAKIGIILLFFGVASGLKLAAEYGLMPVQLRLFLAAAGAVALIVFGVSKAREDEHRTFGLALQGGGFALLYLVGYFMLERYAMIGQGPAFGLFAALGVACVALAARQDGPALAVLGLSGAFLAPVLAGGHADSPLPLFSYFALLNVFILAVDWFKAWRVLNIAGFILTLAIGMAWAIDGYQERHYLVTQFFVVLFLAAYSAMPVATLLLRAPGSGGWRDAALIFGTPLVGIFLQARLMSGTEYGLAWSALIASLWYFALWAAAFRRGDSETRLIERAHLALGIAFLTVSVPLAFGAQVTSAFWAAEGAAVLWFGVARRRLLAQGTGLAMQFAAGAALLAEWPQLGRHLPVANEAVLGALILAAAGLFSARLLRSLDRDIEFPPAAPFGWALLWLLGAGFDEIARLAPLAMQPPSALLFVAAVVLGLEGLAALWDWPQIRASAVLLLGALWVAAISAIDIGGHPLNGFMVLTLPACLALHYLLLVAHDRRGETALPQVRHVGAWWLLLLVIGLELSWQIRGGASAGLWHFVAWAAVLAAGVSLPAYGRDRFWPFAADKSGYLPLGAGVPGLLLALLLTWANFNLAGEAAGLPYLPVLNFFDLAQLAGIGAILAFAQTLDDAHRSRVRLLALALGFLWLSALAARIAHHWGGVPFHIDVLLASTLFQAMLSFFWTSSAIGTMIAASRREHRETWFAGFALLAAVGAKLLLFDATGRGTLTWTATLIGVALLVLAAGYFAPLPPKSPAGDS